MLQPVAARLGLSCSAGACGDNSRADPEEIYASSPANSFINPLPAVQLEGPADLPRSRQVDMQPVGCKSKKQQASLELRAPAVQSRQCAPAPESRPEEVQRKPEAPSRTLKFYPQPTDDRSKAAVDVIEHGFEVLIVRRDPSPSPKCPASMLPQGVRDEGSLDSRPVTKHYGRRCSRSSSRGRSPEVRQCKDSSGEVFI